MPTWGAPIYDFATCSQKLHEIERIRTLEGADTGFPTGGGANPPGGGANIQNDQLLQKNCMKLRKFWSVRGRPLGSTTAREGRPKFY